MHYSYGSLTTVPYQAVLYLLYGNLSTEAQLTVKTITEFLIPQNQNNAHSCIASITFIKSHISLLTDLKFRI